MDYKITETDDNSSVLNAEDQIINLSYQNEKNKGMLILQEKYDRLFESYNKLQNINENLEDKLLKLVDRNSGERVQLTSDVAALSVKLAEANYSIAKLETEIARYKTDINLAIQLLHCNPDNFIPQKMSSLPIEIQTKVSNYIKVDTNSIYSDSEDNQSNVGANFYKLVPDRDSPPPSCPFPPTAMVYSMRGLDGHKKNNSNSSHCGSKDDILSTGTVIRFLESEIKTNYFNLCEACESANKNGKKIKIKFDTIGTQTNLTGPTNSSLCLRCSTNLNSPSRINCTGYSINVLKSNDSVISETKSSVSDLNDIDKIFSLTRDEFSSNLISGHHHLCEQNLKKIEENQQIIINNENQLNLNEANDILNKTVEILENNTDNVDLNPIQENNSNENEKTSITTSTCETLSNDLVANDEQNSIKDISLNLSINNDQKSNNHDFDSIKSTEKIATNEDGAKIFEDFNKKLIKTIKAEHPSYRRPRLCAMRLNGSRNILLDNIETNITPILYTRRERLLDEELNDLKPIITSRTTNSSSNKLNDKNEKLFESNAKKINHTKFHEFENKSAAEEQLQLQKLQNGKIKYDPSIINLTSNSMPIVKNIILNDNLNLISQIYQEFSVVTTSSSDIECKRDTENLALKQQQLTRVAEWIQNNTKTDEKNLNEHDKLTINKYKSLNNKLNNNNSNYIHNYNKTNENDIFILKEYDEKNAIAQKHNKNSLNEDQIFINESEKSLDDLNHQSNELKPNEDKIFYNTNASNNNSSNNNNNNNNNNSIDLTQMEYNVKKFLLKQNEWSKTDSLINFIQSNNDAKNQHKNYEFNLHSDSISSTKSNTTLSVKDSFECANNNNNNNNNNNKIVVKPLRTETNL